MTYAYRHRLFLSFLQTSLQLLQSSTITCRAWHLLALSICWGGFLHLLREAKHGCMMTYQTGVATGWQLAHNKLQTSLQLMQKQHNSVLNMATSGTLCLLRWHSASVKSGNVLPDDNMSDRCCYWLHPFNSNMTVSAAAVIDPDMGHSGKCSSQARAAVRQVQQSGKCSSQASAAVRQEQQSGKSSSQASAAIRQSAAVRQVQQSGRCSNQASAAVRQVQQPGRCSSQASAAVRQEQADNASAHQECGGVMWSPCEGF